MNSKNQKVVCLKCGIPFNTDETINFKVVSGFEELMVSKNIHICKCCINLLPKANETTSLNTPVIKFIS